MTHPAALADINRALKEGWIKVRAVSDARMVRFLRASLDRGEAEAIALGMELPADLVLIDERDGRSAAERAGLRLTGVLGILLRAKQEGQITAVRPEIEALRSRVRFFISARLEQQVLRNAGE